MSWKVPSLKTGPKVATGLMTVARSDGPSLFMQIPCSAVRRALGLDVAVMPRLSRLVQSSS